MQPIWVHFSTVPLTFFCERHGHARPSPTLSDRAFDVFLQKARSRSTPAPAFRPCLSRFFAKGTVAHDPRPHFSTVPLALFWKRHGRARPLPPLFDRAFGAFLRKARSRNPSGRTFRPCLWLFFVKGTVAHDPRPRFSTLMPHRIFSQYR